MHSWRWHLMSLMLYRAYLSNTESFNCLEHMVKKSRLRQFTQEQLLFYKACIHELAIIAYS